MNAALLLSSLEGVRRTGHSWRANCPKVLRDRDEVRLALAEDRIARAREMLA